MIETLSTILPIIIYSLLIVFLVVVIVLGIKIIITIDMINNMVADVQNKIQSLNSLFKFANIASDKLSFLGTRVVDSMIGALNKIIGVKKRKDEDDYV